NRSMNGWRRSMVCLLSVARGSLLMIIPTMRYSWPIALSIVLTVMATLISRGGKDTGAISRLMSSKTEWKVKETSRNIPGSKGRVPTIVARLGLILWGVCLAFLIGELAFWIFDAPATPDQIWTEPHSQLGYILNRSRRGINSLGIRERPVTRKQGEKRILV